MSETNTEFRASRVLMVPVGCGEPGWLPAYRPLDPGEPEYAPMDRILSLPYIRSFLRIGHACQALLASQGVDVHAPHFALRAPDPRPAVGFRLESEGGSTSHADVPYTMLDTAGDSFERGEVEAILLHEYGHVLMFELLGTDYLAALPRPYTRMHLTTTCTDYTTAFMEGWGVHLECVTADLSPTPGVRAQGQFDPSPYSHFLCRAERRARLNRVRANDFIHLPIEASLLAGRPAERRDLLTYQATHGAVDPSRLMDPQAMLSSEGVAASFLYRLAGDREIRAARAEPEFYRRFLPEQGGKPSPCRRSLSSPLENVYLKLAAAIRTMALDPLEPGLPPMVEMVAQYGRLFPAERERVCRLFLECTAGVTACTEAPGLHARLHTLGRLAQIPRLREAAAEWQDMVDGAVDRAVHSSSWRQGLVPLLGPELWLRVDEVAVPEAYWLAPDRPLVLNLNTCSLTELTSIPGMTARLAEDIVRARSEVRGFRDLHHLRAVVDLQGETAQALCRLRQAFVDAPPRFYVL